jgi:hypothetical protein
MKQVYSLASHKKFMMTYSMIIRTLPGIITDALGYSTVGVHDNGSACSLIVAIEVTDVLRGEENQIGM